MATQSSEFKTVKGSFVAICDCISEHDVVRFAGELLQINLISDAGHQTAIAVTGLSPSNKVAHLVSEAANKVSDSPDNFYKFVSILESRNKELASALRNDYSRSAAEGLDDGDHLKQDSCVEFATSLRRNYNSSNAPTWDPLPQCPHVKLAMIKAKGQRYLNDKKVTESRVKGEVCNILTTKEPVDSDRIFEADIFDEDRQVILVEGVGGMGKTSLAYQYAQKWAKGNLSTFDVVALVRFRDLNEHDVREPNLILPHLLTLASGECTSEEMAKLLIEKQKVLLVLDGWDEAPIRIRTPSFVKDLLRSVSPQTRVLITSRPDFSLHLHSLANRVEILGFTKGDIYDYFEKALKSQLPKSEVTCARDKLIDHFRCYPVIESCCYVPLNAAILAYIYFNRNQSLPITRSELFQELVLCCIVRELETRQPNRVLEDVSSFENLPADLKEQLHKLCELAFKGVMENKIVFTQKELTSLSTLGLLHSVQGFGSISRKSVSYNFIHLSIQELLAAYYISRLEPTEHSKQFEIFLKENRKFPVLQYYAGLTGLTNKGVRKLITEYNYNHSSNHCRLTIFNCIFEAHEDVCFKEMADHTLKAMTDLHLVSLSPMDCLSVHYFLSSIRTLRASRITLNISNCSIDDQSLSLLLGISTEHAETSSTSGVLESVETLDMTYNEYTDTGIVYIARSLELMLISNSTLKILRVGNDTVTDMGLVPLLKALPRHDSMRMLELRWSSSHPDKSLKKIGDCLRNTKLTVLHCLPSMPSEVTVETVQEWVQNVDAGGKSLICHLQHSKVEFLLIDIVFQNGFSQTDRGKIRAQLQSALTKAAASIKKPLTVISK